MATKESVLESMLLVADALQTGGISPRQMDIFYKAFLDISDEDLNSGCWSFIKSDDTGYFNMRMPPPGIILKHVRRVLEQQKDQIELEANEKWSLVYRNICRGLRRIDCNLSEKVVRAMGGWEYLGMMEVKEEPWKRKDFVSLYCSYKEKQILLDTIASNEPNSLENDSRQLKNIMAKIANAKKLTVNS